ncbi:hypothetical protein [Corynebacterium epidermidicanis]|uniref:Acetyl-CoA acetyltransferase n=1 Tax=Corynebacterium epidermidicanis TaxID=1050174 RepID=A0A0G3GS94_9CORY|nr:hypothetical protein [Corynebacterium epidermidicanis]AKK04009.1 hypothetical protein CEPID_10900 [Corynebacterium epidermidicanis]
MFAAQTTHTTPTLTGDPFEARFGHRLPRGLRAQAFGLQWRTFMETFAPGGDLRLSNIHEEKGEGGKRRYFAQLTDTRGGRRIISGREQSAFGPARACTEMLWELGRPVEIISFHQCEIFEATVTFIYAGHLGKEVWAVGFGPDNNNSVAAALSNAAHRLHG